MNHLKRPLPVPSRSDLYSPEPREDDWGMIEGLASYLARLAEYHAVSVYHLMTYLAAKAPPEMLLPESMIRRLAGYRSRELNGLDSHAEHWSTLVADQTLRTGMEQMTLLPWRHLMASYNLLHASQHWCPQCLDRWRLAGQPIYWPLLWSVQTVTVCPIDHLPLEWRCYHCGTLVRPLAASTRTGFCPNCKVWLGFGDRSEGVSGVPTGATGVTDEALKLAEATRAMLAASPFIQEDLTNQKFLGLLDHCLEVSSCTQTSLAQRLGTSRDLVYHLNQQQRVTVATVLQLLACMELNIADFVCKSIATLVSHHLDSFIRSLPTKHAEAYPAAPSQGQTAPTDVRDRVRAALEAAVAEENPPNLKVLAQRAGVTHGALWYHYPELCRTVSEKRKLRSRAEQVQRILSEATDAEVPPPPLYVLASQLKTDTRALYTYFGDEVAALQARRTTVEMLAVQKKLEAFLETDPPISMTEVAHRLGWSTQSVRRNHPHLYQTIVRRFADYRHARAREREQQARLAVREAVLQLHTSGQFPTHANVAKLVHENSWLKLTDIEREAFDQMMDELRLRQY